MYGLLRLLVLGACNLNDTVDALEKAADRWPRVGGTIRDVWDLERPVVHSLQDTLQLIRLCSGELEMPSWIARYIYASPPPENLAVRGQRLGDADLVLYECSTSVEIAFREFRLNRNEVKRWIRTPLLCAAPDLQGSFDDWFSDGLLKQNEDLARRGAEQLLAAIPNDLPLAGEWRQIIAETRGVVLDEQQIEQSIVEIRDRFSVPFGVVMPALRYTPDGRGWCWPPEFAGQLEDACIKIGLPMFDMGDVVREHGPEAVLQDDLYHVKRDFPGLLDATLSFATKVVGAEFMAKQRATMELRARASQLEKNALAGALAWVAADARHEANAGSYYLTRFSQERFFPDYDVAVAAYCVGQLKDSALFVELGTGLGELSVLLALGGLRTLGMESDVVRYGGASAVREALRSADPRLDNCELMLGLYPGDFAARSDSASGKKVLVCSHVTSSYVVENLDEVVRSFSQFDDLVIDVGMFGKTREGHEIGSLISRIEGQGFSIANTVLQHGSSKHVHFKRHAPSIASIE